MIRFGPSGNAREFYEQGKKNSGCGGRVALVGWGLTLRNLFGVLL